MKNIIKEFTQKMYLVWYNRKYKTKIYSTKASLNAHYGIETMISENVVVTEDVSIGNYSYVNKNSSLENCSIGNYCSISSGVYICPYEQLLEYRSTHPFAEMGSEIKRERVIIGNDVLISLNVIILSGVTIGNGAVIGAGAVVTKDVKPFEIVGGVPAKHMKWRFDKNEQELISKTRWWDYNIEKVKENKEFFLKTKDFFC